MSNLSVYVIHSAKPLAELRAMFEACGEKPFLKIIYKSLKGQGRRKEETKKTIVFTSDKAIQELETKYPELKEYVVPYDWKTFPLPHLDEGETWDLHISGIPNDYTVAEAEAFVVRTLSYVCPPKSEGKTNYVVEFAPWSRETGQIRGYGKVKFMGHLDHLTIQLCKLVLHNTPLSFKNNPNERRMVTCIWHRDPEYMAQHRYEERPIKVDMSSLESINREGYRTAQL